MNKSKSKILDLLYGKIFTYEERIIFDEETNSLILKACETENAFFDKIKGDAELTDLFKKFLEVIAVAHASENDLFYSDGFKTGLLIGIEAGEWAGKKLER